MPKFQAPEHVTSIFTGGVEYRADRNGIATLPHDAPAAHVQALAASGWTLLDGAAAAKPPKAPRKPSKGGGGSKKTKPAAPAPADPPAGE